MNEIEGLVVEIGNGNKNAIAIKKTQGKAHVTSHHRIFVLQDEILKLSYPPVAIHGVISTAMPCVAYYGFGLISNMLSASVLIKRSWHGKF